jgi:hypothetical protein
MSRMGSGSFWMERLTVALFLLIGLGFGGEKD